MCLCAGVQDRAYWRRGSVSCRWWRTACHPAHVLPRVQSADCSARCKCDGVAACRAVWLLTVVLLLMVRRCCRRSSSTFCRFCTARRSLSRRGGASRRRTKSTSSTHFFKRRGVETTPPSMVLVETTPCLWRQRVRSKRPASMQWAQRRRAPSAHAYSTCGASSSSSRGIHGLTTALYRSLLPLIRSCIAQ